MTLKDGVKWTHLGSVPLVHYKLRTDTTVEKKSLSTLVWVLKGKPGVPLYGALRVVCRERDNYRLFSQCEISTNYSWERHMHAWGPRHRKKGESEYPTSLEFLVSLFRILSIRVANWLMISYPVLSDPNIPYPFYFSPYSCTPIIFFTMQNNPYPENS